MGQTICSDQSRLGNRTLVRGCGSYTYINIHLLESRTKEHLYCAYVSYIGHLNVRRGLVPKVCSNAVKLHL